MTNAKASVIAEEVNEDNNREVVIFTPEAVLMEQSGLYFFIIYKNLTRNQFLPVYKSEVRRPNDSGKMQWNQV